MRVLLFVYMCRGYCERIGLNWLTSRDIATGFVIKTLKEDEISDIVIYNDNVNSFEFIKTFQFLCYYTYLYFEKKLYFCIFWRRIDQKEMGP